MIHPLVRKELREHLWALVALWTLCVLGVMALLAAARDAGSPLVAWQRLVTLFGVLLSLALANRLVVREYGGRTQLFLETLPLGRGQVIAVKWLTGAACLLAPMAFGFALTLLAASGKVELTAPFVLLLALRGITFLLFFYALAFAIGLTGRYRYVLWLAILLLAFAADLVGQVPIGQWPPLQLVSESMPFQREGIPVASLWITWVGTAVLVGAAFVLVLGFQGSWVVALSRRMSLREKVVVSAAFLSALYAVMHVDERKPKSPFELQDAVVSTGELPRVSVARAQGVRDEDAFALAQRIATDLRDMREYLGLGELPVVAVLPDASIDSDLFMLAELPDSDGVVVRGAFGTEGFDESGFRAFTIVRVMDWYSRGRAMREERRWLLEGLAWRQIARDDPAQRALLALRAAVAAETVVAGDIPLAGVLRRWLDTREQLGDCLGDALAWQATGLLLDSLGTDNARELSRTLFGARAHPDVRAILADKSLDTLLRRAGAPTVEALTDDLREAMRGEHARLADEVQAVRRWPVAFEAVPMRGSAFELRYDVALLDAEVPPPFAVRHARLGPWEGEVPRTSLARLDATASGVLPASFPRGTRVLTAVEMHSPQLACTVRLGTRRWVMQ